MKNWKKYFFEFIVVFLGVTFGLLVEEYRESKQNLENYQFILEAISNDLKNDKKEIQYPIEWAEKTASVLDSMISRKMSDKDYRKCTECRWTLMTTNSFQLNMSGYKLMSSGLEFSQIDNKELLAEIEEFYSYFNHLFGILNTNVDNNAMDNMLFVRDNCEWFGNSDLTDENSVETIIDFLLNDKDFMRRARHTRIIVKDNYLPYLKYTEERIDELIEKIKNEQSKSS